MNLDVVLVPYDSGRRGYRMGAGPLSLVEAGLLDQLSEHGHEVRLITIELGEDVTAEIAAAFQLASSIRRHVTEARSQRRFPLVLAGNCFAAVGVVAALDKPAIYWFDAHADLNTPETTRSGFLDGMALSVLLGRSWSSLSSRVGLTPVEESEVWLLGARDLDPAEAALLSTSKLRRIEDERELPRLSEAGKSAEAYLHIDLDVLDSSIGSANSFATPGGFSVEGVESAIAAIAQRTTVTAAALTAYDPAADRSGSVQRAACRIANVLTSTES